MPLLKSSDLRFGANAVAKAYFGSTLVWPPSTTQIVNFTGSNAVIANPERGFFQYTETHYRTDNTGHVPLVASTLSAEKTATGRSLIFRYFVIEKYINTDTIDQSYLDLLSADLAAARMAGVKLIIRFTYSTADTVNYAGAQTTAYGADTTLARILKHIYQLAPVLNVYADVIDSIQAGFVGIWGEWYYTDNFGDRGVLTAQNWADRKSVLDALLDYLDPRIFVLLRYPGLKVRYLS